ncbi:hypothetical protein F5Y08DRAFT_283583 [Xylaria arbuscula]|nr:hypothetical protein F5Y08DRAFT_283583 [Xylaria arbuscula]
MERRPTQNDTLPSHTLTATRQPRTGPRDVQNSGDYTPVREAYLIKNEEGWLKKRPPKADREISKYEDYLRNKWGCNDAIPDSFDPDKLDAALKSARSRQQRSDRTPEQVKESSTKPVIDLMMVTETETREKLQDHAPSLSTEVNSNHLCECSASTDTGDQPPSYDSEASISDKERSSENTTQTRGRSRSNAISHQRTSSETTERSTTPRIRAGSKPPLSRSAFAAGGVPCENEGCQGQYCKREAHRRVKAPAYFPFKSRGRGSSQSRGRSGRTP